MRCKYHSYLGRVLWKKSEAQSNGHSRMDLWCKARQPPIDCLVGGLEDTHFTQWRGFLDSSIGKESTCSAGNPVLIPALGRSPGEGKGYPLQYSGLENSMDCISPAAAKSLQSCPTLCDPIDGSSLGSPVPGILQARTLEWVAISFSNACKWKVKVKSLSPVRLFVTPWTPFSRQEYWSG